MAVAKLNEYAQRARLELRYEDVGSVGLDHIKTFTVRAIVNGTAYDGVGKNKKEAKQNAASNALRGLEQPADPTGNAAEASTATVHQTSITQVNYICWLNEYGHKNRVTIRPVETTRPGLIYPTLCCSFIVGDKEYPVATGKTRKEAKEEAAKLVHHEIYGIKTMEIADESYNLTSAEQMDTRNETGSLSGNLMDSSFTETNFIGLVNHYCQKTNRCHTLVEERRCGPSHSPQFFYKVKIDSNDYPVGEGKTAKEAKQNAARLAWSALQEQSDWDSKVSVRSTASEGGGPPVLPSTPMEIQESSSQSTPTTGRITESSNASEAEIVRSTVSDVEATTRDSLSWSQSTSTGASDSAIFTDSMNSSNDQLAVNGESMGNNQNGTSKESRFTSEYDPMECIGSGAFGYVFKARQKLLNKNFAVKIVRSTLEGKALREVMALSDLHHRNIVRYYESWIEDSGYRGDSKSAGSSDDSYSYSKSADNSSTKYLYIRMELCDTKTLKDRIYEMNKESLQDSKRREESLSIALQIVSGVAYIHLKEHIHRDLKPDNILFGLDGEVKIGDFGLVTKDDEGNSALMERTRDIGTPTYMAPEQKWKTTYDRKVDIFPLGLIYLELLWKVSSGHERGEILRNAKHQRLPKYFFKTFPQESQIIKQSLSEEPSDRPEAESLKEKLEEWTQTFNSQNGHQKNATV